MCICAVHCMYITPNIQICQKIISVYLNAYLSKLRFTDLGKQGSYSRRCAQIQRINENVKKIIKTFIAK